MCELSCRLEIVEFQATEKALAAKAAGPLPGGYAVGEKVYFTGMSKTASDGYKWTLGQAGKATGPATAASLVGKGLLVANFPWWARGHGRNA